MNIGKWHWSVWVKGLISAVISGGATGLGVLVVAPEAMATFAGSVALKMAGVGALVGAANYLKQSPIPTEDP